MGNASFPNSTVAGAIPACDPGRTQKVLRWCLIDGAIDSEDFRHKRDEMIAGATTNNARTVYDRAISMLDGHDHVGANLVKECGEGNALTWSRDILGIH